MIPFGSSRRPPLRGDGAVHCSTSWAAHWQPADESTLYVPELFSGTTPVELFFEPSLRFLDPLVKGNCSGNDAFTPRSHAKVKFFPNMLYSICYINGRKIPLAVV
jgi:hypothetical protein